VQSSGLAARFPHAATTPVPSASPPLGASNALLCIAVLGRFRVERRASGEAPSVMTIADESAVVGSCATVWEGAA
jgi:hypothetical protein